MCPGGWWCRGQPSNELPAALVPRRDERIPAFDRPQGPPGAAQQVARGYCRTAPWAAPSIARGSTSQTAHLLLIACRSRPPCLLFGAKALPKALGTVFPHDKTANRRPAAGATCSLAASGPDVRDLQGNALPTAGTPLTNHRCPILPTTVSLPLLRSRKQQGRKPSSPAAGGGRGDPRCWPCDLLDEAGDMHRLPCFGLRLCEHRECQDRRLPRADKPGPVDSKPASRSGLHAQHSSTAQHGRHRSSLAIPGVKATWQCATRGAAVATHNKLETDRLTLASLPRPLLVTELMPAAPFQGPARLRTHRPSDPSQAVCVIRHDKEEGLVISGLPVCLLTLGHHRMKL